MEAMEKAKMDGWVDLHSHVLPEMDDGCKNCEESGIGAKKVMASARPLRSKSVPELAPTYSALISLALV